MQRIASPFYFGYLTLIFWLIETTYVLNPEHETVPMGKEYRVVKDPQTGEYIALKGNQTSKGPRGYSAHELQFNHLNNIWWIVFLKSF